MSEPSGNRRFRTESFDEELVGSGATIYHGSIS